MKYASIPVFIPHLACGNDCVFCNQRKISGAEKPPGRDIYPMLEDALLKLDDSFSNVDIAFFGGSFTGIPREEMIFYLTAAKYFKERDKRITGIRLSTRPDYISKEILDILKSYGVTAVELGAQSMCDEILRKSRRGHTAGDTKKASVLIKEYGFELILQFMPGLPGDSISTIRKTYEEILFIKPCGVRIYPCVVIKDTALEDMYLSGEFKPLTVEEAVEICAECAEKFYKNNIKIIRMGLHSSDLVKNSSVVAGPFHPAFGELVQQRLYFNRAYAVLSKNPPVSDTILYVAEKCTSKMTGIRKDNLIKLKRLFGAEFSVMECHDMVFGEVRAESKKLNTKNQLTL